MDGMTPVSDFVAFAKIARLSREVIVTEKIDGTNAQIEVSDDGLSLRAGSRSRWITPGDDNYGFARWCEQNTQDLLRLGPGRHFGEWWGKGIQRNYSQTEKRFSLFNVSRWAGVETRPACCGVVPTLYSGPFEDHGVMKGVRAALVRLQTEGSVAAPGFMKPEGIVVFHAQGNVLFKKTFEKDEAGKEHGA